MLGDEDHQTQIVLNERPAGRLVGLLQGGESGALLLPAQRGRQHVAPADVKNRRGLHTQDREQLLPQEQDLWFT